MKKSEARARAIERGKPKRNERGQILRPLSARSINRTIDHLQHPDDFAELQGSSELLDDLTVTEPDRV